MNCINYICTAYQIGCANFLLHIVRSTPIRPYNRKSSVAKHWTFFLWENSITSFFMCQYFYTIFLFFIVYLPIYCIYKIVFQKYYSIYFLKHKQYCMNFIDKLYFKCYNCIYILVYKMFCKLNFVCKEAIQWQLQLGFLDITNCKSYS